MATKKTAAKKRTATKKTPPTKMLDLSKPIRVPIFGKGKIDLIFDNIDEDDADVQAAVRHLMAAEPSVLAAAAPHVANYRHDASKGDEVPALKKPSDVWKEVDFGFEMSVSRLSGGPEAGIYFSLECNCEWEPEHGLQLVVRDGKAITKVGPYDGHLTTARAYANKKLIGVVYKRVGTT